MLCFRKLTIFFILSSQYVFCYDDGEGILERLITSGSHIIHTAFQNAKVPCVCGIFLESQTPGDLVNPGDDPAYYKSLQIPMLPCGVRGNKLCQDRCLDEIVPHIPRIGPLMCSAIQRNCFRERATLYYKNCDDVWISSELTLGREFCCYHGEQVRCPRNWYDSTSKSAQDTLEITSEIHRALPEVILNLADKAVDIVTEVLKDDPPACNNKCPIHS